MRRLTSVLLLFALAGGARAADAPASRALTAKPGDHLRVEITTHLGDNQRFRAGDELTFLVNLNRRAFLAIIFQDAEGRLIQVLPNREALAAEYEAGWYFTVPSNQQPFRYRVAPPFGDEYVYAYACDRPLPELPGEEAGNGLRYLRGDVAAVQALLSAYAREQGAQLSAYRAHMVTTP